MTMAEAMAPQVVDEARELRQGTLSDWFNPILVKEARQATSSPAFAGVLLTLIAALAVWTIFTVAMAPSTGGWGRPLLLGYACILSFVMLVIVPWMAHQSMASELQGNTLELLMMSSISPGQVIRGKLHSVMAITGTFFSAIAPCFAFGYLAGNLSLLQVLSFLATVLLASWFLSSGAIFLAASRRVSPLVVLFGLGLVQIAGGIAFGLPVWFLSQLEWSTATWRWLHVEHSGVAISVVAMALAAISLFNAAGAASLTFPAANRSSPLRWRLLVLAIAIVVFLVAIFQATQFDDEPVVVLSTLFYIIWLGIGSLLVAERSQMSSRARRAFPASPFARIPIAWMIPGNATGYLFAISVIWAYSLIVTYLFRRPTLSQIYVIPLILFVSASYYTFFLGLTRFILVLLRRHAPQAGFGTSFCILAVLLVGGHLVGWACDFYSLYPFTQASFTMGGFLSWPRALEILLTAQSSSFPLGGIPGSYPAYVLVLVGSLAALVVLLTLPAAAAQIFAPTTPVPHAVEVATENRQTAKPTTNPFAD